MWANFRGKGTTMALTQTCFRPDTRVRKAVVSMKDKVSVRTPRIDHT